MKPRKAKDTKFIVRRCKGCKRKSSFLDNSRLFCVDCRIKRCQQAARLETGRDYANRVLHELEDDHHLI